MWSITIRNDEKLKLREIIKKLKRGEKFEAIINELENDYGFLAHHYAESDSTDYLRYVIPRLKQKYFPDKVDKPHFFEATSKNPHLKKVYFKKKKAIK